jgi:hypothetical protein
MKPHFQYATCFETSGRPNLSTCQFGRKDDEETFELSRFVPGRIWGILLLKLSRYGTTKIALFPRKTLEIRRKTKKMYFLRILFYFSFQATR